MKKTLIATLAVLAVTGGYFLSTNMDADYNADALAATDLPVTVTVTCATSTTTAFAPTDVAYAITAATTNINGVPTYGMGTTTITGPVDADTNVNPNAVFAGSSTSVTVPAAYNGSGGSAQGFVYIEARGPFLKVGGVECTNNIKGNLKIYNSGANNAAIDFSLGKQSVNNTFTAAEKIDLQTASSDAIVIFGATSPVISTAVPDQNDRLAIADGDVSLGGVTTDARGQYEMRSLVQITNITNPGVQASQWLFGVEP